MTPVVAAAFDALVAAINGAAGAAPADRVASFGYVGGVSPAGRDDRGWTVWFLRARDDRGNAAKAADYIPTDAPVEAWRDLYRAAVARAAELGYANTAS